jgi:hypothetical protein
MGNQNNITLLKDKDWESVEGKLCRVASFNPLAGSVKDGKVVTWSKTVPYASIMIDEIELKKIQEPITGFVTHRIDFMNLWHVFKDREVKEDEIVAVVWTKENFKSKLYKLFPSILPKMIIMIFTKEGYRLTCDESYKPELTGEARFLKQKPIEELRPESMQ